MSADALPGLKDGNLAGLGLPAASFTAYRDLTLGVKSTFLPDPLTGVAVLGRLGVPDLCSNDGSASAFRPERKIDFSPENFGSFDTNPWPWAKAESSVVDLDR
jgi:hypothetical protein